MQRVSRASAVASLPAPPAGGTPGFFTGGNPGAGQPATVPGYEWFNAVQEELLAVILRGGLTASNADLAQVRKSLDRLFGGGLASVSANTTLTVDDAGLVLVSASGGARTITLPAANALGGRPIRFEIEKTDSSANAVTVQRAGTDTIEGGTSVVLSGQWASLTLVSDGAGSWVLLRPSLPAATSGVAGITRFATAAETDAGTLADVAVTPAGLGISARSFGASGYARMPGGLILQWGLSASISADGNAVVTFPITFPSACQAGFATVRYDTTTGSIPDVTSCSAGALTASNMRVWHDSVNTANVRQIQWLALGN